MKKIKLRQLEMVALIEATELSESDIVQRVRRRLQKEVDTKPRKKLTKKQLMKTLSKYVMKEDTGLTEDAFLVAVADRIHFRIPTAGKAA